MTYALYTFSAENLPRSHSMMLTIPVVMYGLFRYLFLVRQGDIGPGDTVASNAIANLELELKGKGVVSEGNRPPNIIVRTMLRIVGV